MKLYQKLLSLCVSTAILCTAMAGCTGTDTGNAPAGSSSNTASKGAEASDTEKASEPEGYTGPKELTLYLAGFQNQDPHIWTWGTHVDRMGIFEGLTKLNNDLTARMGNAESVEHNADYTVWTAKLKKDLKWSDGTPINANDYYWSMQRVIDPQYLQGKTSAFNTSPPIVNVLECAKGEKPFSEVGIKVVDDYTLEFTLFKPKTDFDTTLAESWALPVPKTVIEAKGDDWSKPENIVVNGPYIPTDRKEDTQLVLEPNKNYHGEVSFDKITVYMGTQNQLVAYQNGDINIADINAANIDAVLKDDTLKGQLQTFESGVVSYIGLLKSSNDVLQKNPKIRQAISLSIDREIIATQINKNTTTAAYSLVSPKFATWGNDKTLNSYNVEKAKALMKEAGFENGAGLPEMTYLIAGTTPGADTLAIADMITKGTGIKVKIVNQEWASFVKDRDKYHDNDGIFGIFSDGWGTSVPGAAGYFANSQFDIRLGNLDAAAQKEFAEADKVKKVEDAARAKCKDENANAFYTKLQETLKLADPAAADAAYKELEEMRQADCSFIPFAWVNGVKLIRPEIKGYVGNPLLLGTPPMYFNDITIG